MRANKKAIISTAVITTVCLIICIILREEHHIVYDLSLACFGSALLGIVVATTAYMSERRDAMEQFAEEVGKAIVVLGKISIIEITDIVHAALIDENSLFEKTTENSDKLKEYIESRLPIDESTTNDQINEWIESVYKAELEDARRQLRKAAAAYIAVGEFDISSLNTAYGRLDFLIGNNSIRKKAYQNLYNKVYVFKRACLEHCLAFRPYVAGHGNEVVCMDKMLSLQSQVFENRDGAYYAKLRDELRHDLETFRSQTYNVNPEYEDPYPVHYFINFEDTESVERYKRHIEKAKQEGRDEQTKITSV